MPRQSWIASATINPCRFVKQTGTTGNSGRVTQCGSGDTPYGVSEKATRRSPFIDTSGNAAQAGEPIVVHDENTECALEIAATITNGTYLKPDTNGKGVAASTGDIYGAIAMQDGVAGGQILVKVLLGTK